MGSPHVVGGSAAVVGECGKRDVDGRETVEVAVGGEALEGHVMYLSAETPSARQLAAMPSRTQARCAPSELPAKSMLSRSLATF
jgi:hypothetical protein